MTTQKTSLNSLTGLRWWAAFAVFLFHMTVFAPLPIFPIFEYGHFGVMFFFILSGFVLTWSWRPEVSVRTFYLRRFGRIWPAATVALILAIPVFYSFNPDPSQWWVKPFDLGILMLSIPLIQGWWLAPIILFSGNPAAWTLTCEFFFYSVHPFFQRMFNKSITPLLIFLLFGIFSIVVLSKTFCTVMPDSQCLALPLPITTLPEFLLGMLIGLLAKRNVFVRLSPLIPIFMLTVFYVFLSLPETQTQASSLRTSLALYTNEITLLLMVLIIATVANTNINSAKTLFSSPLLVKLGEVSFTFYLVHATVMYSFVNLLGQFEVTWANLVWYPIVLAAALAISFPLHLWVEKPFEKKIRRFSNRFSQLAPYGKA
jgi:peptidoglycan/LPS O-acetylase OafA/YrhL